MTVAISFLGKQWSVACTFVMDCQSKIGNNSFRGIIEHLHPLHLFCLTDRHLFLAWPSETWQRGEKKYDHVLVYAASQNILCDEWLIRSSISSATWMTNALFASSTPGDDFRGKLKYPWLVVYNNTVNKLFILNIVAFDCKIIRPYDVRPN